MDSIQNETIQMSGFQLHLIPNDKIKTITIGLKLKNQSDRETVTKRAMLPFILRKGSQKYPTESALQKKLDELYGATLSTSVDKGGNYHILNVYMDIVNHKFIENEKSFLGDALHLLQEIVYHPLVDNGAFDDHIVEREKDTIRQQLKTVEDDKMSYSNLRLIDEMFTGDLYQIRPFGYEEDLNRITGSNLYEYYQSVLKEDVIDMYIVGDFNKDEVKQIVEKTFPQNEGNRATLGEQKSEQVPKDKQINEVIEKQQVQQSRLHLGFRTGITYKDDDFGALQVYNMILGGYPSSKLFLSVREKHSLAYYVGSGIDSFKDLLVIFSGIASQNYNKTRELIDEGIQSMCDGDFSERMISEAKAILLNHFRSSMDSAGGIIELFDEQQLGGAKRTPKEMMEMIEQVSKEDIINVANKVKLDTVYFLTSEEEQ